MRGQVTDSAALGASAVSLNSAERRLLCLLPPRHVLQIGSDKLDIAVAQIIGKRRHDLSRPAAYGFRVADQIVQPLRCQIFSRVLRQVEIGADIGSAGSVKLVTGEALHKEESLADACRVCRRQRRIDGERRPAQKGRRLARQLCQLIRPLLAADAADLRPGPHNVERPRTGAFFLRKWRPRLVCRFDCKPSDSLAPIGVEQEIGRELRDEPVERDRLDHGGRR